MKDDQKISEILYKILSDDDYLVDAVYDGMEGLYFAGNGEYDAIILDVMLPKMDGFEVLNILRNKGNKTPILMLTARTELDDRVQGLDLGADDYLTKPFAPRELLARLRALIRRGEFGSDDEIRFEDLIIHKKSCTLSCGSHSVDLNKKELEMLSMLLVKKGEIIPKEIFIVRVWGDDSDVTDNNVEAYISFIRKKLKYIGSGVKIKVVRKMGYKLEVQND